MSLKRLFSTLWLLGLLALAPTLSLAQEVPSQTPSETLTPLQLKFNKLWSDYNALKMTYQLLGKTSEQFGMELQAFEEQLNSLEQASKDLTMHTADLAATSQSLMKTSQNLEGSLTQLRKDLDNAILSDTIKTWALYGVAAVAVGEAIVIITKK